MYAQLWFILDSGTRVSSTTGLWCFVGTRLFRFFCADASSICFFRTADVNEEGASHLMKGMSLPSCLWMSTKVDTFGKDGQHATHGKASISHVTIPGSREASLLYSGFITLYVAANLSCSL